MRTKLFACFLGFLLVEGGWENLNAQTPPPQHPAAARRISSSEVRTWIGTNGSELKGWLEGADATTARIVGDKPYAIKIANLSPADVAYVDAIRKAVADQQQKLDTATPGWSTDSAALASHLADRLRELPEPAESEKVEAKGGPLAGGFEKATINGSEVFVPNEIWHLNSSLDAAGHRTISLSTERPNNAAISEGFSIRDPLPDDHLALVKPLLGARVTFEMEFVDKKPRKSDGNLEAYLSKRVYEPGTLVASLRTGSGKGLQLQFVEAPGFESLFGSDPLVLKGPYPLVTYDVTAVERDVREWAEIKKGSRVKWMGVVTGAIGGVVSKTYPNDRVGHYRWMALTLEEAVPVTP